MMHDGSWFGMGGGGWVLPVIRVLVIVLLVVVITEMSNRKTWRCPSSPWRAGGSGVMERIRTSGDISD
jgi:hypothetical protein